MPSEPDDPLLTTAEVAAMFRVNVSTVNQWAQTRKLKCFQTFGGHRRFRTSEITRALKAWETRPADE